MLHVGENCAVIETLLEVTLFVRSRYNYVCILYRFGDIPNTRIQDTQLIAEIAEGYDDSLQLLISVCPY